MAYANTSDEARVLFEALEIGVHGVVLRTKDPSEVRTVSHANVFLMY